MVVRANSAEFVEDSDNGENDSLLRDGSPTQSSNDVSAVLGTVTTNIQEKLIDLYKIIRNAEPYAAWMGYLIAKIEIRLFLNWHLAIRLPRFLPREASAYPDVAASPALLLRAEVDGSHSLGHAQISFYFGCSEASIFRQ
jgi:hypothetical protein